VARIHRRLLVCPPEVTPGLLAGVALPVNAAAQRLEDSVDIAPGGECARFALPGTVMGSDASSPCGQHQQEYDPCIGPPYGTDTYFLPATHTLLLHAKTALE
jgi:hypothetical protein